MPRAPARFTRFRRGRARIARRALSFTPFAGRRGSRPDQRKVTQLNALNPEFVGVGRRRAWPRPTSSMRKEMGTAMRPR